MSYKLKSFKMRSKIIVGIIICMLIFITNCAPLPMPMVQRLSIEDQEKIDQIWDNLLNPIDQADRKLLLDVLITNYLFQSGVDKLELRATKSFKSGTIVMQIFFDRNDSPYDRFIIEIFDRNWNLVRRESYNRSEVEKAIEELSSKDKNRIESVLEPEIDR
jgi:hypothetical protein